MYICMNERVYICVYAHAYAYNIINGFHFRPVGLVEESRRLQEEKQVKAQLQRSKIHEEKAQKSKMMSDKVQYNVKYY